MKFVFVCRHGEFRSAYSADFFKQMAEKRGIDVTTDYFGVKSSIPNSERRQILDDADCVYVMEPDMVFDIQKVFGYQGEVRCLNIPDVPSLKANDIELVVKKHFLGIWPEKSSNYQQISKQLFL